MSDIVLPWRHRPGTDMISKLVLQEKPIVNVVVEYVIGMNLTRNYLFFITLILILIFIW